MNQRKLLLWLLVLVINVARASPIEHNWSPSGKASQSSTNFQGDAQRAIDGNRNGNYLENSVTHTNSENSPFWEIDLGRIVPIDLIRIYNRTDCCADRLNNFYVFACDSFSFKHRQPVDEMNAPRNVFNVVWGSVGSMHNAKFQEGRIHARYIRIQLAGPGALSLAEVEIIQQDNIIGPSVLAASMGWVNTNINNNDQGFAAISINGSLNTFFCGQDGVMHWSQDLENDKPVPSSPHMARGIGITAVYIDSSETIFVAAATADGTLQIGERTWMRKGINLFSQWSWTALGNTSAEPAVATSCGKIVVAWLDNGHIMTKWKKVDGGVWSEVSDVGDAVGPPSLATTNSTPYGAFGLGFLRNTGQICFVQSNCSAVVSWSAISILPGTSFGGKVALATYGDHFAMAFRGADERPYFSLQVSDRNGFPRWSSNEPVRAASFQESPIKEAPVLTVYRGMFFVVGRDVAGALYYWYRLPNHMASQSFVNWCGGRIVGGTGASAGPMRMASVGSVPLNNLPEAPGELYILTAGINDKQIYGLNFGRSVSLDLLQHYFQLELVPNTGHDIDLRLINNLSEHVLAITSLPDLAWKQLIGKKCDRLSMSTLLMLNYRTAGQARTALCPMELSLNADLQSAAYMLHEWMHVDFNVRKIRNWTEFNAVFGDHTPMFCDDGRGCGADSCALAKTYTDHFDDPDVIRWANRKVCVERLTQRPQGAVGFYDFSSAEHCFIEVATRYRWEGDELRFNAAKDAAKGNFLLQKKYDWIKKYYYTGIEFNGWNSSPGDRSRAYNGRPNQ